MKEDVARKKILRRTNKSLLIDLDRYVDEVHCQRFNPYRTNVENRVSS